ncbi:UNVERIFIED_CONTAM: hypothetical protein FKN15_004193 [Acipenser sinensis]
MNDYSKVLFDIYQSSFSLRPNPPSHRATLGQLSAASWELLSSVGKGIAWTQTRDVQTIGRIRHSTPTMQPPQNYSVGGQCSSGQLTDKPTGVRPVHRGRWCTIIAIATQDNSDYHILPVQDKWYTLPESPGMTSSNTIRKLSLQASIKTGLHCTTVIVITLHRTCTLSTHCQEK